MNAPMPPPPGATAEPPSQGQPDPSAAPTLTAAPTLPTPAADTAPPTVPTLPDAAAVPTVPTLPTPSLPSAPTLPTPSAPAAAPPSDGFAPPAVPLVAPTADSSQPSHQAVFSQTAAPTPAPPARTRRSGRGWIVAIMLVTAGAAGWFVLGNGGDDGGPSEADPPVSAEAGEVADTAEAQGSDSIGQIGADAISGSEDLVEIINDRGEEAELLAELGLDPTGEPLPEPAEAATPPAGHTFRWTDRSGATATITVNAASGDHSLSIDDGLEYRSIADRAFARTAGGEWTEIDGAEIDAIERPGLVAPLTLADLLGPASTYTTDADGRSVIDDASFATNAATARQAWLDLIGLSDTVDGQVTVAYDLLSDGTTLANATIERAATDERVSYELAELHRTAPVIESPAD